MFKTTDNFPSRQSVPDALALALLGTLFVSAPSAQSTSVDYLGTGCIGSNSAAPLLRVTGLPHLGATLEFETSQIAANSPVLMLIGRRRLDLDFAALGLPGCIVFPESTFVRPATPSGSEFAYSELPVPFDYAFLGAELYSQAAVLDTLASPLGITFSRGAHLRFGTTAVNTTARISVKRVLRNASGQPETSPWSLAQITAMVESASAIFEREAGIRIALCEIVDVLDPTPTNDSWYVLDPSTLSAKETLARAAPSVYGWRFDAINLYVCGRLTRFGGVCSFPGSTGHSEIIVMQQSILNGTAVGLAHELGHYFDVQHTHASDSRLTDLRPDASPGACVPFSTGCHRNNLAALGYPKAEHDALRYNFMSYHGPTDHRQARLSPDQRGIVMGAAASARAHVLTGRPSRISLSGSSSGIDVAYLRDTFDSVLIGDFTGDGRSDVIRTDAGNWFLSAGAIHPWEFVRSETTPAQELGVGDFDGDGTDDVFRSSGGVWEFAPAASGAWTRLSSSSVSVHNLGFADFDGDGRTDVLRTRSGVWQVSYGGVSSWQQINQSSVVLADLQLADFDGDGSADAFRTTASEWQVSYSASTPWMTLNRSSVNPRELLVGDFDGDGRADVLRANGSNWTLSSSGTSGWVQWNRSAAPRDELRVGDFDADGEADVLRIGS